jgi:hypothetical protein
MLHPGAERGRGRNRPMIASHRVRLSPYSGGRAESRPVTCQDIIDVVQEAVEWHANR